VTTIGELAASTPATRDRGVDFLRAASILTVVIGHWFIGLIYWQDGVIGTRSAIGVTSFMWLGTWVFQVMPIFFFVGGFSNLTAFEAAERRGEPAGSFVRRRVSRLLRPSLVFLGIWAVVQIALHVLDVGGSTAPTLWGDTTLLRGMRPPPATVPFGPLWFLGFYLVVVTIAPITVRLHRRYGWGVIWVMAAGAVACDALGFTVDGLFRWGNVVFVLLLPHQLGHFLADGSLARLPRLVFWGMIVGGLAGLVLLTNPWIFEPFGADRFRWFPGIGYYPKSLLGTDAELVSNAYPPTLCYLFGGVWSIGAVMLLRLRLARWLERPRPWRFTIAVNSMIMTLFLWHMTAYLIAILVLWPLGLGRGADTTATWWLERPVWIVAPGLVLAAIVAVFARFERPPARGS